MLWGQEYSPVEPSRNPFYGLKEKGEMHGPTFLTDPKIDGEAGEQEH